MSRLDYITMAIVAICILAIVFLVYKMTDLFGGDNTGDTIENVDGPVETEDTTYDLDPNEDLGGAATDDASTAPATGSTSSSSTSSPASSPATQPGTAQPSTGSSGQVTTPPPPSDTDAEEDARPSSYNTSGKYMVLAGSFSQKSLAEKEAKRLHSMGYENAKVELFNRGKFAVVLVDRFSNMADAERLSKKLQADGVKNFVKIKEGS